MDIKWIPTLATLFLVSFPTAAQTWSAKLTVDLSSEKKTYLLYKEAKSYQQARELAESENIDGVSGYLLNIDSSSENTRVFNWLAANISTSEYGSTAASDGGGAAYIWLGGDDRDVEGDWLWQRPNASGYPKLFWRGDYGGAGQGLYTNWGNTEGTQNEPDNYQGNQDAVAIALETWPVNAGFELGTAGQWNDVNVNNGLFYVVEFDTVEGSNSSGGSGSDPVVPGTPEDGEPVGGCDSNFVTLSKTTISVAPNGEDDSVNIQCALDAAIDGEYSAIKLTEGTFYVGPLYAQGFKGAVQGKTKASTVVVAVDEAFACSEATDAGTYAAMFQFSLGEPQIKFMTLQASQPCQTTGEGPDSTRFAFIYFNSDTSNCSKRTMFPKVDRLNIVADYLGGDETRITGVLAATDEACEAKPLLGKVLVNRSEFSGLSEAVETSLASAAQVDISFNTFSATRHAVVIFAANQITNIVNNTFNIDNGRNHAWAAGVLQVDDKRVNRTVIDANTFNIANVRDSGGQVYDDNVFTPSVLVAKNGAGQPKGMISVLISNNKFNLSLPDFGALWFQDTDSGIIAGNLFSGKLRGVSNQPTNYLMFIEGDQFPEVTGWSIVDNDFSGISDCGAVLTEETARFVVGPDQACAVIDQGSGNFVLK